MMGSSRTQISQKEKIISEKKRMNMIRINQSLWFKQILYFLVDCPGIRQVYRQIYNKKIKKVIANKPDNTISIEPSNICNLECIMCPYPRMTRPKTEMKMEQYKKVVDSLPKQYNNVLLSIYNEPFLDKYLIERIKYAKNKGLSVMFFSNGTLLNQEKVRELLECPPTKIVFSVDSNDFQVYTKIRKKGEYAVVASNILYLMWARRSQNQRYPEVQVNMIQMDINNKTIRQTLKFWKKNVDQVQLGALDNRARNHHQLKLWVKESSKYVYPCPRAFYDVGILSDGRVTFCACQDYDGIGIIGDTRTNPMSEILNSDEYKRIRELHLAGRAEEINLCASCTYLNKPFLWWGMR